MKVKSESEVAQSCPTLSDPMDCSLLGSSVQGIFPSRNQFPFVATKNPDERGSYCIHEGTNTEDLKQGRVQENEEKEMHSTDNEKEEVPGGS